MRPNPYNWQKHNPQHPVPRRALVSEVAEHLRRGAAVKITGARGLGKSVTLQQIQAEVSQEPGTRVVLVDSPPEDATVPGAVRDLAARLGIGDLSPTRMDDLVERILQGDVTRLVVLFDEADQYVALGTSGPTGDAFARAWFNKLEATRKRWDTGFGLVFAGGLGLFYLEHELGSGIVSRAEPCDLSPFTLDEIEALASPFRDDGRPLDATCLATLLALSGGIPALITYGLERLWTEPAPTHLALENCFGVFRDRHDSFIRSIYDSISRRRQLEAPRRVLDLVRRSAGSVPMDQLRDACASAEERLTIDPEQALKLLRATGLLRTEGSLLSDPVAVWPVPSILNLPEKPSSAVEPAERLVQDVAAVLANLRRFGRDFYTGSKLLPEEVFSSLLAVGLRLLGWQETDREAIQVAGFTDVKVRLKGGATQGHAILEVKIWRQEAHNKGIQEQIDAYRTAESHHAIAVTIGARGVAGWVEDYERVCLSGRTFKRLPAPPDLVGRWRVGKPGAAGREEYTDHLLVQIAKRT